MEERGSHLLWRMALRKGGAVVEWQQLWTPLQPQLPPYL